MESVTLENGNQYVIVNEITDDKNCYVYMTNLNDRKDFCVRKSVKQNEKEYFVGLKDEEELKYALKLFIDKNI